MNDLDKKLLEAIYQGVSLNKLDKVPKNSVNWFKATANGDVYEFVIDSEQIKQAFVEAGYSKSPLAGIRDKMAVQGMMTGQEWYDRFENELKGWNDSAYSGDVKAVAAAAQKASGAA